MKHHRHPMPFGAALDAHGASFSLWAPSASQVDVLLEPVPGAGDAGTVDMKACGDGWFRVHVPGCGAGQRYRYRVVTGRADGGGAELSVDVPDPAARFNPEGVEGPSEITDPERFEWDVGWLGRPWHEAVCYELHVGTFTPEGSYRAAEARLPHLAALGVTAIELMPLAEFAGKRGWGYDGVLQFAPHAAYGTPDDLKHFIRAAHRLGLMVMLDVVYNHFGPAGNYLHVYAEPFFNPRHSTPWGASIGFDGAAAPTVRNFYAHNALYWLEEFRFDGLRLDAVHAIQDDSARHILDELPQRVRAELDPQRHVHLVLENEENQARWLAGGAPARRFDAQWNDDFHHAAHVALTGEASGYYADYAEAPVARLARSLAEGFIYQGEPSAHREGRPRGEPSAHLPPTAFVGFLQNHDQIGNRPYGERLTALAEPRALEAMTVLWLLAPAVPMLFMGEEFGAATPFRYFCDFDGELGAAVSAGRRREVAGMLGLDDPDNADPPIPDPGSETSLTESRLDWAALDAPAGQERLALYQRLLALRRERLLPRLPSLRPGGARHLALGERGLQVAWPALDGSAWIVQAHLGDGRLDVPPVAGEPIFVHGESEEAVLGAWSVRWFQVPAPSASALTGAAAQ